MSENNGRTKLSEKGLLTPDNCVVTLIDLQPQMLFGVSNFDRQSIINNNVARPKPRGSSASPSCSRRSRPRVSAATSGRRCVIKRREFQKVSWRRDVRQAHPKLTAGVPAAHSCVAGHRLGETCNVRRNQS